MPSLHIIYRLEAALRAGYITPTSSRTAIWSAIGDGNQVDAAMAYLALKC